MSRSKKYALTGIFTALLLTFLDQWSKYAATVHLMNQPEIPLIKGALELKYLENRGMAFGMLQGKVPLLILLCAVFFALLLYFYIRVPKKSYYLPLLLNAFLMFSGALGNLIDRVFRGYVVDFIYFSLIDFPIFNLADIYVVCSGIILIFLVCVKYKDDDFTFLNPGHKE